MELPLLQKTFYVFHSLLKITRETSYNYSGKFKGIYVIGSSFHYNLLPFSPEVWKINNALIMDLMKRIFEHIGTKSLMIKYTMMLRSKTMIDEDEYNIINNDIGHYDNLF